MAPQSSLRRWERGYWLPGALVVAGALGGCSADPPGEEGTRAGAAALGQGSWESKVLRWGDAPEELGLRAGSTDFPAEGPSSVAVGPGGSVVILDRIRERVVEITPSGQVRTQGQVARDVEHVAVGPDGAVAGWSPLRATVWISARDGSPLGEVVVPREIRDVVRIDLGISRRVLATTSMQETLVLGSPRLPLDLAAALRSKREGAAFLADGRGVAARVTDGGAGEILVYRTPGKDDDGRTQVGWTFEIEAPVAAVRVVGAAGNVACARVERVTQAPDGDREIVVEREALCVEADTGSILAKRPMGRRGLYTMHADVAVGGSPPVLAVVKPLEDGLSVERVALGATSGNRSRAETKEVAR